MAGTSPLMVWYFCPAVFDSAFARLLFILRCLWFLELWCLVCLTVFQDPWPPQSVLATPAVKELFPIVLACAVWGMDWAGQLIFCHSDNAAAVMHVNCLYAHYPIACHMLRCLALFLALHKCRSSTSQLLEIPTFFPAKNAPMFLHCMSHVVALPPRCRSTLCQHTLDWTPLQ